MEGSSIPGLPYQQRGEVTARGETAPSGQARPEVRFLRSDTVFNLFEAAGEADYQIVIASELDAEGHYTVTVNTVPPESINADALQTLRAGLQEALNNFPDRQELAGQTLEFSNVPHPPPPPRPGVVR